MKRFFPLSLALSYLWTLGACSTGNPRLSEAGSTAAERKIETREQLLSSVNTWMRNHNQPELTQDELLGRVVDEAVTSSSTWKEIERPVESFIVCFKSNKRFKYPVKLQTDWLNSIKLRYSEKQLRLPPHHTLSLHILATYADIWPSIEDPRRPIDLSMPIGTALVEQQSGKMPLSGSNRVIQGKVETPEQLLTAVNIWRRRDHQTKLTLDEITARTADEMLFRHDLVEMPDPIAESFLISLAKNRRFEFPTRLTSYGIDDVVISSSKDRLLLSPHEAITIEVANHQENDDLPGHPQFVIHWTRIILSYNFPTPRRVAGQKP